MSDRMIIREYEDMRESEEIIIDALIKYGSAQNKEAAQRIIESVRKARKTESAYRSKKRFEKQREAENPGLDLWIRDQKKGIGL